MQSYGSRKSPFLRVWHFTRSANTPYASFQQLNQIPIDADTIVQLQGCVTPLNLKDRWFLAIISDSVCRSCAAVNTKAVSITCFICKI